MTEFCIQIGTKMIDLMDPKPDQLDMNAIETNLKFSKRFSGAPGALSIYQHANLVVRMIEMDRKLGFENSEHGHVLWQQCCKWPGKHDHHEGVLGDIVAPVKRLISSRTNILEIVEIKLDRAISDFFEIEHPSEVVRGHVHRYDKAAETLEWLFSMNRKPEPWNCFCPKHLKAVGPRLIGWARDSQ